MAGDAVRYARRVDVVWRLAPDRVLVRRPWPAQGQDAAADLLGRAALIWIALDEPGTIDDLLERLADARDVDARDVDGPLVDARDVDTRDAEVASSEPGLPDESSVPGGLGVAGAPGGLGVAGVADGSSAPGYSGDSSDSSDSSDSVDPLAALPGALREALDQLLVTGWIEPARS